MSNSLPRSPVSENVSLDRFNQFNLYEILTETDLSISNNESLGYYVKSTAPYNVDASGEADSKQRQIGLEQNAKKQETTKALENVACHLTETQNPEIVVSIHGYAYDDESISNRYESMYGHAAKNDSSKQAVFLGYIWPSEKPSNDFRGAISALPILLLYCFVVGFCFVLASVLLWPVSQLVGWSIFYPLLAVILFFICLLFVVIALILLRLSNYFRDSYRATNYGVPDLVELLRQIDHMVIIAKLIQQKMEDSESAFEDEIASLLQPGKYAVWQEGDLKKRLELWYEDRDSDSGLKRVAILKKYGNDADARNQRIKENRRVKLSFIGHSMGCFVVTNTIRILSDVFDDGAMEGEPGSNIGRVFCLERLVLVAPDIPIETIMPRRANFLRASLRRCKEAYVFCSEADLALRLASPIANYFSFPAQNRISGYRLGNVTAQLPKSKNIEYGIINLSDAKKCFVYPPFKQLEIRAPGQYHELKDIRGKATIAKDKKGIVADQFTYFDCTDYVDCKSNKGASTEPKGILSFAKKRKKSLNLRDYFDLFYSHFVKKTIDTHGGYFEGVFSQKLIYDLAFIGFQKMLPSFDKYGNGSPLEEPLENLSKACKDKQIKVVLTSIPYKNESP